jgi:hypothetical protein
MKILHIAVPVILAGFICGFIGYTIGQQRERRVTVGMIESSFISDLSALESLRAGDTTAATRSIEAHGFMSATVLLNDPAAKPLRVMDMFRERLVAYRRAHRANSAEWTPMEQKLEQLLSQSK